MTTKKTIMRLIGLMGRMGAMNPIKSIQPIGIMVFFLLFPLGVAAQITIGGNVYGGGNQGNVNGSTRVTVKGGDLHGKVFAGARMANVGGNAFVNIDGEGATDDMIINHVYGGNDIAGTIGTAEVPDKLKEKEEGETQSESESYGIDNTWNTFVHVSAKTEKVDGKLREAEDAKKVFIGQVFGAGNGDYFYKKIADNDYRIYKSEADFEADPDSYIASNTTGFTRPNLGKTFVDIHGGTIGYIYGGGNNATVTENTTICMDNPTSVITDMDYHGEGVLTAERVYGKEQMGMQGGGYTDVSSDEYLTARLFGGNNYAEMAIRPKWHLKGGSARDIYSGGNRGAMTSPEGLLLEIPEGSEVSADNIYGGCRMADVFPSVDGEYRSVQNLPGYKFPNELSARVLVRGGHINNVYGGNDITGVVYGGNAVGIYAGINGNVYGGGNGAYPYSDKSDFKDNDIFGDYYYNPTDVIAKYSLTPKSGFESVAALNKVRPNAEQVSIRLKGTPENPTIIHGSVFCGGNCASLDTKKEGAIVELKIGSDVIADKVFLGNNGEKMVAENILRCYAGGVDASGNVLDSDDDSGTDYSTLDLTTPSVFAEYMDGVAMHLLPDVVFDNTANGDPDDYVEESTHIGSFYCGGNVGSMAIAGQNTYSFEHNVIIYDKLVGGCNSADVEEGPYNAAYEGGILGAENERGATATEFYTDTGTESGQIRDRLVLDLSNLEIQPKRWKDAYAPVPAGHTLTRGNTYYTSADGDNEFVSDGTESSDGTNYYEFSVVASKELVWNTVKWNVLENDDFEDIGTDDPADDEVRRLRGGNIYGGCYNSGHVNGNVVININETLMDKDKVFTESVVDYESQRDDLMALSMTVFGAGYGKKTEIWGSTTVNHNKGYCFQIFGGGEQGVVGKKDGSGNYTYNAAYSSTVNLKGLNAGYSEETTGPELAETEYIYGGGNEGNVCGNTYVYLGNGRIYDAFGGACNADILGAANMYIGYNGGFPWIRDNVYGGNDFGGIIKGSNDHLSEVRKSGGTPLMSETSMANSSTYVKYIQGRVDNIFGGNYGSYEYKDRLFQNYTDNEGKPLKDLEGNPLFFYPHIDDNSFVHFQPIDNAKNKVGYIFGGSEGIGGHPTMNNTMQGESYVLIDDTNTKDADRFANLDVYGGGSYAGLGSEEALGAGRSIVDLYAGRLNSVYGGCDQEGLIGYTRVNVPTESTIKVNSIFGGGKGYDKAAVTAEPELAARFCDNYVTCVDYRSENAIVEDALYGGNKNSRISFDAYLNISAPVNQGNGYQATIYGAGYGDETISGRTTIYMNRDAKVYKVFGGGRDGNVFNFGTLKHWLGLQFAAEEGGLAEVTDKVKTYGGYLQGFRTYVGGVGAITLPSPMPAYNDNLWKISGTDLVGDNEGFENTNVHLMEGSTVTGYAYGGGFGSDAIVSGTTYVELKGGNVDRDIYGGGQGGHVYDEYDFARDGSDDSNDFTATTNVYIEGGMVRNVYGGGYLGHVGKHTGDISTSYASDIPAVANVVIGKTDGSSFLDGIPAITRNAYGGGEGGSVYGTSNVTLNNGYIGYRYKNTAGEGETPVYRYVEELDDQKPNAIDLAGNVFGGGYVVNSYVDVANVTMYGGTVRGCLYGGGEIGPIGRGTMKADATGGIKNNNATIYKAGKTNIKLYDGWVKRNVFGGGRGKDSWGGDGTKYMDADLVKTLDMKSKGYVFGQTEVNIYGGEVGTNEGMAKGYGNVFGGGDIGFVYSAYELADGTLCIGKKSGVRYDNVDKNSEGYYYKYENGAFKTSGTEYILTEDCKVLVEPWCKSKGAITLNDKSFAAGEYVPTSYLNYLGNKNSSAAEWAQLSKADKNKDGIIIHNAVFAGGNTSTGSMEVYAATTTVYGNATASINDVYHRDLITVGTGHTGGLYGEGNLTFVDGYRELNITNYGTDYYNIKSEITKEQYDELSTREQAYYEIRYRCLTQCKDKNGRTYTPGSTISDDEMQTVFENYKVDNLTQVMEEGNPKVDKDGYPVTTTDGTQVYMLDANGIPLPLYWTQNGVCSRYAGRIMNTIQRADFCGVFGSRMVMKGAMDRVPAVVDYTNYTINRVREVSLNKNLSVISGDAGSDRAQHGNYFGIYNNVNFLGALTSDFDFGDGGTTSNKGGIRTSSNENFERYRVDANGKAYETATFYDWKKEFHNDPRRNNGNSHNRVALASGVYLELTTEQSTGTDLYEKVWGYITGVVELDLISVQPGLGGGFVYAKNVHGKRYETGLVQTTLTQLNENAITRKMYTYDEDDADKEEWQTSGNFVHSTQTIIDDCYNIGDRYKTSYLPPSGVPAHYWYIKGSVYIYDQYISAYTGLPNAYSEVVNIPLTITSASHGRLQLLEVQPNLYAYYSGTSKEKLGESDELVLRDVTYKLNDPINYWDWYMLSSSEKQLFVEKTYVTVDSCKINGVVYPPGHVMLPSEYSGFETLAKGNYQVVEKDAPAVPAVISMTKDKDGNDVEEKDHEGHVVYKSFYDVFRESNNVSHNSGYILTYKVDNPNQWNTWYTPKDGDSSTGKKDSKEIESFSRDDYEDGPTYTPIATGLYGQQNYTVGNIISNDIYTSYATAYSRKTAGLSSAEKTAFDETQATFEPAYIVTKDILEVKKDADPDPSKHTDQRFYKDAMLCASDYSSTTWNGLYDPGNLSGSSVEPAYIVTGTIQLSATDYIYKGTYMTSAQKEKYKTDNPTLAEAIDKNIVPAYYCSTSGKYGGDYYEAGHNYRGLEVWSSMSEEERENFNYNYDALDVLIDPTYSNKNALMIARDAQKYQYDSANKNLAGANANKAHYSLETPIDYEATYKGSSLTYTYNGTPKTITTDQIIGRDEFESLLNERYYYSPITVKLKDDHTVDPVYVVNESMILGDIPYAAGQAIDKAAYDALGDESKVYVTVLTFDPLQLSSGNNTFYFCRQSYEIAPTASGGVSVSSSNAVASGGKTGTWATGNTVPVGAVINTGSYEGLTNNQANFTIHGTAPVETSTLYVPRESDIDDVSTEKIITVVYQYDYVESDMDGKGIVPYSERHVLNIHLQFKSGVPTVEDIEEPDIILPGTTVSLSEPFVTPGAYEVTGGGWTLFDDPGDAESHTNGIEYIPNVDPLYLYQNRYYVAYYAQTYLGKTYSNSVPVHVANYHDIKKVMDDNENHYYIDHKDIFEQLKVEPKIYIKDYSSSSENGLDIFKELYDLSILDESTVTTDPETGLITTAGHPFRDHKPLNDRVEGCRKLEFFLQANIEHTEPWTSIASKEKGEPCFQGTLHGDGYTLIGLTNSLFDQLCGDVYNLGVTGSFSSAGIANTGGGYVENCWINTEGTPDENVYAVFGAPEASGRPKQIVNCYYQEREGTNYKSTPASHGVAKPKPQKAFYNGEVAYDLNGFYLYKRYSDKQTEPTNSKVKEKEQYQFFTVGADNNLEIQPVKYYARNLDNIYSSTGYLPSGYEEDADYEVPMYVEDRFADGDFRYAGGTIPEEEEERLYTWTYTDPETNDEREASGFFPIWPDDYLFFGQMLTYDYGTNEHQKLPTAIARDGGRLSQTASANRVYRAPAYFRSKEMNMAHFNPNAYLAQYKKDDASEAAYPHMTAIDFAGHYDTHTPEGPKPYLLGWSDDKFYLPLLDDDGLLSIKNCDETQNLLVYAPAETPEAAVSGYANEKTYTVLNDYFTEPMYGNYYDSDDACTEYSDGKQYDRVADAMGMTVYGHLVQTNKNATNDHLLVDKQDFNCPIAYQFDANHLMWYQRKPDDNEFVDQSNGWQGISLPFSARMVTTNDKGEITHFYDSSEEKENSKNGTGTKVGHEYWLRELTDGGTMTLMSGKTDILEANFDYPSSLVANTKTMNKRGDDAVNNTFLWDYYYEGLNHGHQDKNLDEYQTYYKKEREYKNYPLLTNGRPYIIGLPGETYYEFDLSGMFDAKTTAPTKPEKLNKQVVSFVSEKGETIEVSDDEMANVTQSYESDAFTFKPSYLNEEMKTGTFVLNSDGNAYTALSDVPSDNDKNKVSPSQYAFRPYFMENGAGGPKRSKGGIHSIAFSRETAQMIHQEEENDNSNVGELIIKGRNGKIIVTSTLAEAKDVVIVTAAGALIDRYTIQPGRTIETSVSATGVYIVNKKKISIGIEGRK